MCVCVLRARLKPPRQRCVKIWLQKQTWIGLVGRSHVESGVARARKKKPKDPLTWSNTCCLCRMHCLCCSFFALSAKQDRVNKPRGNSKVREQIVSFHTDFNFLYTLSVIVLAVSWMCVYSEACRMCGRFSRNSLPLFGGNKSTVSRRTVRLHLFYHLLPVPLGHPLIRFACWCICQLKNGAYMGNCPFLFHSLRECPSPHPFKCRVRISS